MRSRKIRGTEGVGGKKEGGGRRKGWEEKG
jgi:hypothetical protein